MQICGVVVRKKERKVALICNESLAGANTHRVAITVEASCACSRRLCRTYAPALCMTQAACAMPRFPHPIRSHHFHFEARPCTDRRVDRSVELVLRSALSPHHTFAPPPTCPPAAAIGSPVVLVGLLSAPEARLRARCASCCLSTPSTVRRSIMSRVTR